MIKINTRELAGHFTGRDRDLLWAVLDAVDDMVFVKDVDGVFVYNNAAHLRFIGKTREAVTGCTDFDLFPAAEAEEFFANDTRLFETLEPIVSLHRADGAGGEPVLDVAVKTLVHGPDDAVLGLLGIVKRMPLGSAASRAESRQAVMAFVHRVAAPHVAGSKLQAFSAMLDSLLQETA